MQPWLFHSHRAKNACRLLAALGGVLLAGTSAAQSLENPLPLPPQDEQVWLAASSYTLAQQRGGFSLGQGLMVSFGISRAVYINGQLVTSTAFQINDLTRLSAAQVATLAQHIPAQAQVVQNGPGNTVDPGALAAPLTTYIQNTLNDQTLRSQTVIQATSNGLSMVKSLNLQTTLSEAIVNAIRPR